MVRGYEGQGQPSIGPCLVLQRPGHTRAGFATFRLGELGWVQRACVTNEVGTMRPAGLGIEALITRAGQGDALCSLTQWTVDTLPMSWHFINERPSPLEDQGGP